MSLSNVRPQAILTPLASLMGVLALGNGVYCLGNPVAASSVIGIPITTTASPATPFVSFVGLRNVASGFTILTLLGTGQRKAAATCLMCGVVVALGDAWVCAKNGAEEGKAMGHAVMGVLVGALGGGLYYSVN